MQEIRSLALIALVLGVLGSGRASAGGDAPRVLLLRAEGEPADRGFDEQLHIQLAGSSQIENGPLLRGVTPGERVDEAMQLCRDRDATLGVWLERAPGADGGTDYVLYLVGDVAGTARVEVVRMPEGEPGDRPRALALKALAALDSLVADAASAPVVMEKPDQPPPDPPVVRPPRRPARVVFQLEAGGSGAVGGVATDASLRVGAGVRMWWRAARVELSVGPYLASGGETENDAGRVSIDEWGVSASARLLWRRGRLLLGPTLGAGLRHIEATGVSPLGKSGSDSAWVAALSTGVEARWPLTRRWELGAALGIEWLPLAQGFTINQQPVADLGHGRGTATIFLVILLP